MALVEAATLQAEGRLLDAIRLLTEENRVSPDPAVEHLLVRLRHAAFAVPQGTAPPAPAPIRAEGGHPGPLPELAPEELTIAALRAGIGRHGCVLVRGLLPPARVERLVEGIDRALAGFDASVEGAPISETEPWYVPFTPDPGRYRVGGRRNWVRAGGALWTADSPRMLFELLEIVDELGIGALVTEFLGERPALSANKCTLRRVPVTSSGDWHQDGAFLGEDVRTINLWLSLSHCGRDAPGMDIVPRRLDHVVETGGDGANFDWAVSPAVAARAAGDTDVIRPEFRPGDALLFDHLFLHRTAAGPEMPRERHAIETWFFAPSGYPDGQIPLVY